MDKNWQKSGTHTGQGQTKDREYSTDAAPSRNVIPVMMQMMMMQQTCPI